MGFDINEQGISFDWDYAHGYNNTNRVNKGDLVTLRKGDIRVEIKIIKISPDQTYIGQVLSVDPYGALKKDNIREDCEISFSHGHIFSCHHG